MSRKQKRRAARRNARNKKEKIFVAIHVPDADIDKIANGDPKRHQYGLEYGYGYGYGDDYY